MLKGHQDFDESRRSSDVREEKNASAFFESPPIPKQENASSVKDEAEGF